MPDNLNPELLSDKCTMMGVFDDREAYIITYSYTTGEVLSSEFQHSISVCCEIVTRHKEYGTYTENWIKLQ